MFKIVNLFVSDVDRAGKDHCAINAKCILDVVMATVMEVLGNAFVIQTGVVFYVIKVSHPIVFSFEKSRKFNIWRTIEYLYTMSIRIDLNSNR